MTWAKRMIEAAALFLLVFTSLAFGTTEPWSEAVAELVVLGMIAIYVIANATDRELRVELPPGWLPAVLFLVLVAAQAVLPGWSADAHETRRYLLKVGAVAAFVLVCYNTYRTRAQAKRAIWTMMAVGTLISLLGIVQRVTSNGRLYWLGPRIDYGAPFGPYVNRAHFAGLIVIVVPAALVLVLTDGRPRRRRRPLFRSWRDRLREWNSFDGAPRALIAMLVLIMSAAALVSGSRGGVIAVLTALTAMGIGTVVGRGSWSRRVGSVVLALLLVVLTAAWIEADILYATAERFAAEIGRPQESIRVALWADAANLWRAAPLFGTGLGTFDIGFPRFRTIPGPRIFSHAESDWVQLLTDTGATGFILVVATVLSLERAALHRYRHGESRWQRTLALAGVIALGGAVVQGIGNYNLPTTSNLLYLGIVVAVAARTEELPAGDTAA